MHRIDREAVFRKDHGICHLCGKPVNPDYYDVDHVLPRSKGGTEDPQNLRLSHPFCNRSKQDRTDYTGGLPLRYAHEIPSAMHKMLGPNAYVGRIEYSEMDLRKIEEYKEAGLLVQLVDCNNTDGTAFIRTGLRSLEHSAKIEPELLYPVLLNEDIEKGEVATD